MSEERYSRVFSLPEKLYAAGSPIVIMAGGLLKDNQTGRIIAQLKLRNISPNTIKALRVCIHPCDTVGNSLGEAISHQYLDMQANTDAEFGQQEPIVLPNKSTRYYAVEVTEVVFVDNSIWSGTEDTWEPLPGADSLKKLGNTDLIKQFRIKYGKQSNFLYTVYKDLWYCTCGKLNQSEDTLCRRCKNARERLELYDPEVLREEMETRLAEEKAQAVKAAAESMAKAKRRAKIAAIVIPTVATVALLAYLTVNVFIPMFRYNKAMKLMDAGDYTAAIEQLTILEDYKDSQEKIPQAQFLMAESMADAGQYDDAIALFKQLNEIEKVNETKYRKATAAMEAGQYEEAITIFTELHKHSDSQTMVTEAKYRMACDLQAEGKFAEAATIFGKISKYKDSKVLREEATYSNICQLIEAKNADEIMKQIGVLEDSKTYKNECDAIYLQVADIYRDKDRMIDAIQIYRKTSEYRNRTNLDMDLIYRAGKAYLTAREPGEAITCFKLASGYMEAAKLLLDAKYQYVTQFKDSHSAMVYDYLVELAAENYKDSKQRLEKFCAWSVKLVYVNTKRGDEKTVLTSVGKKNSYCHFGVKLSGGKPGEKSDFYNVVIWPNGARSTSNWFWEDMGHGDMLECMWSEGFTETTAGTMTIEIRERGTAKLVGTFSVKLK